MTAEIYISQGEDAVGASSEMVISTILGSCISLCLWDPERKVGGMNHLLLPEMSDGVEGVHSAGAVAMEQLINRLVKIGAERTLLRAKLFGGSSMLSGLTDIGARNVAFGQAYLTAEKIPCDKESVGGNRARRLKFWPATGTAKMRFVDEAPPLQPALALATNDVELF